jgi:GTP cyclohydrolase II
LSEGDLLDARSAARAIDALRRGWPVRVRGTAGALRLLPVESATDAVLAGFAPDALLISGERAATLKLTNQLPINHHTKIITRPNSKPA